MKIEELNRASEGDTLELEGTVFRLKEPNSNDFDGEIIWGQFIVLKDDSGEQGAWLKLGAKEDRVAKGTKIKIKGKLGKEYTTSRGAKARSINNCDFEVLEAGQAPTQSSAKSTKQSSESPTQNGKVDDKVWREKDLRMARESALKNITQFVVAKMVKLEDRFKYAQEDVDFIYEDMRLTSEDITKEFGGTTKEEPKEESKEEKIEKAREAVGKTEFKPASTKQKNIIFGYRDEKGWHKGIIESRYVEKDEIKEIGDPKNLSVEKASEWIELWWGEEGNPEDIGARKQREIDNPRDKNGKLVNALVKGDKTSLAKDILIDEINALRRENFLNDDVKFEEELGYNPRLENLTEKELSALKALLKKYHPKDW